LESISLVGITNNISQLLKNNMAKWKMEPTVAGVKLEARVIPIIVGTLGTIARGQEENLKILGMTTKVELIQKVPLL